MTRPLRFLIVFLRFVFGITLLFLSAAFRKVVVFLFRFFVLRAAFLLLELLSVTKGFGKLSF